MKKLFLSKAIVIAMIVFSSNLVQAKIICCHNYVNIIGPGGSDKCEKSKSSSTISGDDVYVEITCTNPGTNSCPTCRPQGIVTGDLATYDENTILIYVNAQIIGGVTNGDMNYNNDPAVHLTWEIKANGTVTIIFTSNS
jgi:hypothetical protein